MDEQSDVSDVPQVDEKGMPIPAWLRDIQREEKRKMRGKKTKLEADQDQDDEIKIPEIEQKLVEEDVEAEKQQDVTKPAEEKSQEKVNEKTEDKKTQEKEPEIPIQENQDSKIDKPSEEVQKVQEEIKADPERQEQESVVQETQPIKQEPVKQEPIKQEPVKQEPIKQEPAKQDPIPDPQIAPESVKQQSFPLEHSFVTPDEDFLLKQYPLHSEPSKFKQNDAYDKMVPLEDPEVETVLSQLQKSVEDYEKVLKNSKKYQNLDSTKQMQLNSQLEMLKQNQKQVQQQIFHNDGQASSQIFDREGSGWSKNRPKMTKSVLSYSSKLTSEGAINLKRMKELKDIFDFYSRQHILLGKNPTFDAINTNLQQIALAEFLKFCNDFNLGKDKKTYISAFKIVAENNRSIGFDSFKKSLYLLFKIDETPPTRDCDLAIIEALRLDHPQEKKQIMQGFQIPFHSGQKHSPYKQIQPKVQKKTVDLTDRQKEALRQRIVVLKLQRELNRPQENIFKTDQSLRPIRASNKHKLPDEIKLRKQLETELKKLKTFQLKYPEESRMLDEKLLEPFQGLPHIAAASTVKTQGEQRRKQPWEKKSNRLFSVLEVESKPTHESQSQILKAPTFAEPASDPISTYYTLDKLTNMRDYQELNKASTNKHQRINSINESIISLDGPISKQTTPHRIRSIGSGSEEVQNDSIFRPSLIGINNQISKQDSMNYQQANMHHYQYGGDLNMFSQKSQNQISVIQNHQDRIFGGSQSIAEYYNVQPQSLHHQPIESFPSDRHFLDNFGTQPAALPRLLKSPSASSITFPSGPEENFISNRGGRATIQAQQEPKFRKIKRESNLPPLNTDVRKIQNQGPSIKVSGARNSVTPLPYQNQMTPSLKKQGKPSSDYLEVNNRARKLQGNSAYSGYPLDAPQFATPSYSNFEGGQRSLQNASSMPSGIQYKKLKNQDKQENNLSSKLPPIPKSVQVYKEKLISKQKPKQAKNQILFTNISNNGQHQYF